MRIITLSGTNLIQEIDDIKRAISSEENVVFLYNGKKLSNYIDSLYEDKGPECNRLNDMDLYKFKVCYEKTDLELSCSKAGRYNRDIHSIGELLAALGETDEGEVGSRFRIVVENNDRRDLAFILQQLIYIEYPLEKIDILLRSEERNAEKTKRYFERAERLRDKVRQSVEEIEDLRMEVTIEPESETKPDRLMKIVDALDASHGFLEKLEMANNFELKLAVAASKKTGKSTIVNGLLGDQYAPMDKELPTPNNCFYRRSKNGRYSLQLGDGEIQYYESVKALHDEIVSKFRVAQNDTENGCALPDMNVEYVTAGNNFSSYTICDTAGPDLAGTTHKEAADRAMNLCNVAIFAMDYSKYLIDSEVEYLEKIKDIFEKKNKFYSLLIVLNQVDQRYTDANSPKSLVKSADYIRTKLIGINEKFDECIVFPVSALEYYNALSVEKAGLLKEPTHVRELSDLKLQRRDIRELHWLHTYSENLKYYHDIKEVSCDILKKDSGMPVMMRYASYIAQNQAKDEVVDKYVRELNQFPGKIQQLLEYRRNVRQLLDVADDNINSIELNIREYKIRCSNWLGEELKEHEINELGPLSLINAYRGNLGLAVDIQRVSGYEYSDSQIEDSIYNALVFDLYKRVEKIKGVDRNMIDGLITNDEFNNMVIYVVDKYEREILNNAKKQIDKIRGELLSVIDNRRKNLRSISRIYRDKVKKENRIELKFPEYDGFEAVLPIRPNAFYTRVNEDLHFRLYDYIGDLFSTDFWNYNNWKYRFKSIINWFSDTRTDDTGVKRSAKSGISYYEFISKCGTGLREQIHSVLSNNNIVENIRGYLLGRLNEYMNSNVNAIMQSFISIDRTNRERVNDLSRAMDDVKSRENRANYMRIEDDLLRIENATRDYMSIWQQIIQDDVSSEPV